MITIINSSSLDLPKHTVVALLIEETTNQTESQQIKSKQNYCYFLVRGESRSTLGKTSQSRAENKQTQPIYSVKDGIEPGTYWWKASARTTGPTVLSDIIIIMS